MIIDKHPNMLIIRRNSIQVLLLEEVTSVLYQKIMGQITPHLSFLHE